MDIRNIAIIAHVDHGKTTLVDAMLRQSGTFRENQSVEERVMDSNALEKERGITILAKCTSVNWEGLKINIIDTPGHADFGGEVERILDMVDGVVLLVDSAEGPLPQTKFVLSKALKLGIRPMVLINKIDRSDARPDEVLNEIFDLFCSLDASEQQLDFPVLYASGRSGWAINELTDEKVDLKPLFTKIINHVPAPTVNKDGPFIMLATLLGADPFLGRILTGKVFSGKAILNAMVKAISTDGSLVETFRLTKLMTFNGLQMVPAEEIEAGDIIAVAGMTKATVADTICDTSVTEPIKAQPIDPPTISITVAVNDSPFAGQEGTKVTSTMIKDRLMKEAETNIAIKVAPTEIGDAFILSGRGELQLGVLIENMRREGFEMSISRPQVIYKKDEDGTRLEPYEEVVVDVDDVYANNVVSELNKRKGDMVEMRASGEGKVRIVYHIPSRCLIGYHGQFLTDTRGTGLLNRIFLKYGEYKGKLDSHRNGVLISSETGDAVAYAIFNLQDRGVMFIKPGDKVYEGMVVGEHNRTNDLVINVLKGKKLTNMRASGTDEMITLVPPRLMTLEQMMSYIEDDELVEVTPKNIRLRKRYLNETDRKRYDRTSS
jgi:GTP-binding protein